MDCLFICYLLLALSEMVKSNLHHSDVCVILNVWSYSVGHFLSLLCVFPSPDWELEHMFVITLV